MDENTFKKQIEGQLRNKIKGYLQGGCFWNTENDITVGVLINNIENLVQQLVDIAVTHSILRDYRYDVTKGEKDNIEQIDEIIKDYIEPSMNALVYTIYNEKTKAVIFMSESLKLDIVMFTKLQNGKIIEREFGTKENDQQYTPEEVKVILKEAQESEDDGEKFKDGRLDKFIFLSIIADISDKLINKHSPIIFVETDIEDDKQHKQQEKLNRI